MTSVEIRALRARLNMTAEQLAECIGVDGRTICMWELGYNTPRRMAQLEHLAYLADHLLARRSNPDWTL